MVRVAKSSTGSPRTRWQARSLVGSVIGALVIVLLVVSCGGEVSTTEASATPGRSIAERNGCLSCHSLDGSRRAGPSWKGLYGSHVELEDGRVVVADEEYLDRAIREPGREVVKGFAASMPLVSLSDQDRQQVIEYIRSLADPGEAP